MRRVVVHYYARDAAGPSPLEDLASRMAAALEELMGWARTGDEFREADHPRAPDGRFGNKAGEHGSADLGPKPTTAKAKSAKAAIHELLSGGHSFTKEELMSACGIKTEKLFSDYIAMLKNPKYAGPAGALQIVRNGDGTFSALPKAGAPPVVAKPPAPPAPPPAVAKPPAGPPAPDVTMGSDYASAYDRYEAKALQASQYSKQAKTKQEHRMAAIVHREAAALANEALAAGPPNAPTARVLEYQARVHEGRSRDHERMAEQEAARERARALLPADHEAQTKKVEARFLKGTRKQIDEAFSQRFAFGVSDGAVSTYMVRGVKPVDIDKPGAAATKQRKMLGHVYAALEDLERQGYDIKEALDAAPRPVQYAPAQLSRANGLAWQGAYAQAARFTVSSGKRLGSNDEQYARNASRVAAGQPRWTVSADAVGSESTRATIVHELTHALGMQPGIESPAKLQQVITAHLESLGKGGDASSLNYDPRVLASRRDWIKKNISEYAATNSHETDAELAAMVTSPKYVRGTLPRAFEDHVDALFKRRKT